MGKTEKQKESNRKYARKVYYSGNCKNNAEWQKVYRTKCKDICFEEYGGYRCVCCGETTKVFLTLDHKDNDGAAHRKAIGHRGGYGLYLWIIKNNFPPMFQVLCFNCNHGKQLNGGICPHKENIMPFNFEQDREEHRIHHIKMPQGHAHMDEKHQKMGRAPIVSQLPMENRTESQQVNQGLDSGDASLGGSGSM